MKSRNLTFSDKYFNHILAIGLTTSVTLALLTIVFLKPASAPLSTPDVTAELDNADDASAQTFTLPPEMVATSTPVMYPVNRPKY
jgi:hypothetical protein